MFFLAFMIISFAFKGLNLAMTFIFVLETKGPGVIIWSDLMTIFPPDRFDGIAILFLEPDFLDKDLYFR